MKPIMSLERRDAILALANKRTQVICTLMENNHIGGYDEVLCLVDRPVGTDEEIRNLSEDLHIEQINKWYDLIGKACQRLKDLNLTMTDHTPVYWFNEAVCDIQWTYADELVSCVDEQEYPYKGERLFASAIDYFGTVTAEELKTALIYGESEEAMRLVKFIEYAIRKYI